MFTHICKGCGLQLSDTDTHCPECNMAVPQKEELDPLTEWENEYSKVRFHWIISVVLFWTTAGITAGLFLIHGQAYINELAFIAAVFMALGVYLKTKVLALQRKKPEK
ncbi:MAG: hypothetical protein HQL46_03255 [Gammaproteobacteria bacterium]|nr:hypothetical protein [Gammaproteobacteria bacterium]